jgi:hypothetical protein
MAAWGAFFTDDAAMLAEIKRLDSIRTRTEHGWWAGQMYSCSFGPVCEPDSDERRTITLPDDENGMMDVWAGDPKSEEDNRPLVCECGEPANARFIAVLANAAPRLLELAEIGLLSLKERGDE